jgi:hypothetical protein
MLLDLDAIMTSCDNNIEHVAKWYFLSTSLRMINDLMFVWLSCNLFFMKYMFASFWIYNQNKLYVDCQSEPIAFLMHWLSLMKNYVLLSSLLKKWTKQRHIKKTGGSIIL